MIVAGVMSGTSADGIDVAIVRIRGRRTSLHLDLIAHEHFDYSRAVRQAVLTAMNSESASVAELARLNFLLGERYADAVNATIKTHRIPKLDLIGCHGQTLYHQEARTPFLGGRVGATWQTGEAAIIAERTQVPVVSDFRPADMAAGGTGAPLVPLLDIAFFGHRRKLRVLQNLGGIANLTIIPAGSHLGKMERIIAFDTGPGNMVIDACAQRLFDRPYDRNGEIAARGQVIEAALARALQHSFFRRKPPKSAGREQFGREFVASFLRWCGARAYKPDILATATALTAVSIGRAVRQAVTEPAAVAGGTFTSKLNRQFAAEYIVSGGGTKNATLMRMIADQVKPLGFSVLSSDEAGMSSQAKEAIAFALLAYQTWHRQPANVPSATGAKRAAVLGKISYP